MMLTIGYFKPLDEAWEQEYTKDVDMTPWKYSVHAGVFLVIIVLLIYTYFADFSIILES